MSLETDLFDALGPLVSQRAYPATFPQGCDWPAIRYTIFTTPDVTVCGSSDDTGSQHRVQVDVVADTFDAMRTLRLAVLAELEAFTLPSVCEFDEHTYDDDAKVHRAILTFLIQPSTA